MRLSAGEVISDRFRVERLLDAGGMGSVYVAEHLVLKRRVALKIMSTPPTPRAVARFRQEGTAAAQVKHPAIVQVFDAGMHDGYPWLAMELLEGESLAARLARGVLPVSDAVDLALPILDALAAAHRAGVVHRDVKPSNIYLEQTPEGIRPRLLDFGIAKDLARETRLTQTGAVLGTLGYLAPEQGVDSSRVEPRTDLYAVGAVLFHCLAGTTPYDASSLSELVMAIVHGPPPDIRTQAPHTPAPLAEAIHRCLAHDPRARPASAEALIATLRPFAGSAASAHPSTDGRENPSTAASHPGSSVDPTGPTVMSPALPTPVMGGATPPAPPTPMLGGVTPPAGPAPPAARGRLPRGLIGCLVAVALLIVVGTVAVPLLGGALLAAVSLNPSAITGEHLQWDSNGRPLFAEINGGPTDVIGVVARLEAPTLSYHVAAFDGATGERLWLAEAPLDAGRRRLAVVGDAVVLADADAGLRAWAVADGAPRWERRAPGLVDGFCAGPAGSAWMRLESGERLRLDPADGATVPEGGDAPCHRVDSMTGIVSFGVGVSGALPAPEAEPEREAAGFDPEAAFVAGAERLVVGQSPAREPMVGLFAGAEPRWLRTLADAHAGAPEAVALTPDAVFLAYERTGGRRHVGGLDRADGARRFDVTLPDEATHPVRSISVVGDTVWVAHWAWLDGLDARTGERRVRIGRWR